MLVAVYRISGEYPIIKAAAKKDCIDHDEITLKTTTAIKPTSAGIIASYFSKGILRLIF